MCDLFAIAKFLVLRWNEKFEDDHSSDDNTTGVDAHNWCIYAHQSNLSRFTGGSVRISQTSLDYKSAMLAHSTQPQSDLLAVLRFVPTPQPQHHTATRPAAQS